MLATLSLMLAQSPPVTAPVADNTLLIGGIILIALAIALFVVELFIPSGGMIGVAAAVCLVGGIVLLFGVNTMLGMISTAVTLAVAPFAVYAALHIWPETPIGRMMVLGSDEPAETVASDAPVDPQAVVVGDRGRAVTGLRPVGTVLIKGQRLDGLADRGTIEPGSEIQVVELTSMGVRVRQT